MSTALRRQRPFQTDFSKSSAPGGAESVGQMSTDNKSLMKVLVITSAMRYLSGEKQTFRLRLATGGPATVTGITAGVCVKHCALTSGLRVRAWDSKTPKPRGEPGPEKPHKPPPSDRDGFWEGPNPAVISCVRPDTVPLPGDSLAI